MLIKVPSLPRYAVCGLMCVVSTAFFWRPLRATIFCALHDDQYTHIILIVPISAALVYSDWRSPSANLSINTGARSYPLIASILIAALSRWWSGWLAPDVRLAASMLGLVILWISSFALCFGMKIVRIHLFPLCFLLWMVPIPSFALLKIVHWLQQGSAITAWALFSAAGVPTWRDGVLVSIPGLTVEVARECSSIRSSLMLLVTTMVLAHVLLRTSWRKVLLILFAVPLTVAKNGVRIFTLAMLGTRVDQSFLTGRLHHDGGVVFFLFVLVMIALFLGFLRKGERTIVRVPSLTTLRVGGIPN